MRRTATPLVVLVALLLLPASVAAARPVAGCPSAASGYDLVDQQEWWDRTVDGFKAEGITVYDGSDFSAEFDAFAADFGFGDGQGLYNFVWIDQWAGIDKNDDHLVCMKNRPVTPGNPAYFFNGVDNTAA